ncbi:hypothetical protein BH10PSE2_BH10PSE2_29620 [soil metagenome]
MFEGAHLKRRLGQYGGLWLAAFLLVGAGIFIACLFMDLMVAIDTILPFVMGAAGLVLGAGVVATWVSGATLGTKLAILILAVFLILPLLWAPVSAAVVIAFFAQRTIEYSQVYAAFQIGVSRVLFPLTQWLFGVDLIQGVWVAFQVAASVVGFISALANVWPLIRRVLGPEPTQTA